MKRIFPVLALIIIAIFLCGCPQNPAPEEPPTFTDGKIHITNNANVTVYLKLAAIDTTKQQGQEGYRTIVSDTKSLQQGKTIDLDFDFSKFKDKRVQVMYHYTNATNDDSWGYFGYRVSYLFYYQTTSYSIELVSEGEQKEWRISGPEYSEFDFIVEEELCKIPVTNNTGYTIWSQFLAFDDDTKNNPHPMSKKVKIEPGQTVEISYGKYDDYADKEKSLLSIWQDENGDTWTLVTKRWTADAEHPESIIVK